ncbi:MAG: Gldg family protein, partial [Clostridia bacterium]|nr:Gldg family protein [Clostridia bacterium]
MEKLKNAYGKAPALFSLILCFTTVLVSVLLYLGVGLIPRSARTFDVTENKLYTLHSETLDFLSVLDRDVEIILVSETGIPEYGIPEVIMRNYAEKNKHISLSVVSPADVYAQYGTMNEGCAVVKSGEKETIIYSSDYFDLTSDAFDNSYNTYYYLTQQGYDLGSYSDFMYSGYGERFGLFDIARYQSTITNAIRYVTTDKITTLYALTDHGEAMLDVYLYPDLRLNSTELLFGKLSDGIPDEADGVLINNPTSDLTEADKTVLTEYLSRGGKLTVT